MVQLAAFFHARRLELRYRDVTCRFSVTRVAACGVSEIEAFDGSVNNFRQVSGYLCW